MRQHPSAAAPQVQSTLAKLSICRTPALGASWQWCAECSTGVRISNSCGDRHCPQCRGAQRAMWVDAMEQLIVPDVDHYQVVFTLPDDLSSLALGNRRAIFNLLFHTAWASLKTRIEDEQQYEAAAAMALHTWNQHLDAHVHLHAVVPGGGPSLQHPGTWKKAVPPPHERLRPCQMESDRTENSIRGSGAEAPKKSANAGRWWLVDADNLRHEFRNRFLAGLRRLHTKGELKLDGNWSYLRDAAAFENFLAPLENKSWVTYIQPPPTESSQPADIVKYLARYLTGGPISDSRVTDYDGHQVTFTARTGTTHGGSDETEEVELPAVEFVRRWCLHILPKGYTKTRRYGGWSNHHRARYTAACRELTPTDASDNNPAPAPVPLPDDDTRPDGDRCPHCGSEMEIVQREHRTRWSDVFYSDACPRWYRTWDTSG